jgi:hypothetical protein
LRLRSPVRPRARRARWCPRSRPRRARPPPGCRWRQGQGHRRVEVRPGDVPEGCDHHHDDEAEARGDASVAQGTRRVVHHDGSAAAGHQSEDAEGLGRGSLEKGGGLHRLTLSSFQAARGDSESGW